jgi:thiamine pyrophosphate-dependent acetolactate synthase large subunit-like protein
MNEYGPDAWNVGKRASIIHIDDYPCDIDNYYQPETELHGSIEDTLNGCRTGKQISSTRSVTLRSSST